MGECAEYSSSIRTKRKEYRDRYMREEDLLKKAKLRREDFTLLGFTVVSDNVDMRSFCGTEAELAYAIEQLYANDGR